MHGPGSALETEGRLFKSIFSLESVSAYWKWSKLRAMVL